MLGPTVSYDSSKVTASQTVTVKYTENGIKVTALADAKSAGQLRKYIKNYEELFGVPEE